MKHITKISLLGLSLLLSFSAAYAAPIFNITTFTTSIHTTPGETSTITYHITNNSGIDMPQMQYSPPPLTNTIATTSTCGTYLKNQATCTINLNLMIPTGTALGSLTLGNLGVCGYNGKLCSVPNVANRVTVIVEAVPPPSYQLLYSFAGSPDGALPYAGLIQATDGNLYGTTYDGGTADSCTVYKITTGGIETVLYSFDSGGNNPYAGLIQATDGNLYGTTFDGGNGYGSVFNITTGGTETVLYSFTDSPDGAEPYASLIQATDGNLYGTTYDGGTNNVGTVFKITTDGTETVLYSFAGSPSDGANPSAGLVQAADGNLYGTTYTGGSYNLGTVFKITTDGTETVLYSFAGSPSDGANPYAGLTQATDGNLYGTTYAGGSNNDGTVFKITTGGTETVLHTFAGSPSDGANPYAGLIQATDGNLYGTTFDGGSISLGTVFKITTGGTETVLHSFAGSPSDGANPYAGLMQATDGNLYGTTYDGGLNSVGTVFMIATEP